MTTKDIDFTLLRLKDALDLAVLIEDEAAERYGELADQLELHHTFQAARFFRAMEGNEAKHRAKLLARRRQFFGAEPTEVSRAQVFDVEAPEYDAARAFMSLRQALDTALQAERKAAAFFAGALPHVTDARVAALFRDLHQEELDHERLVQAEIDKLPPETPENPDDYGDEPAGL